MDEFSLLCQHSARLVCCCRRAPRGTPGPRLDAMDAWFDAAVDRSLRAGTAAAAAARVAPKPKADGPSTTCLSPSACRQMMHAPAGDARGSLASSRSTLSEGARGGRGRGMGKGRGRGKGKGRGRPSRPRATVREPGEADYSSTPMNKRRRDRPRELPVVPIGQNANTTQLRSLCPNQHYPSCFEAVSPHRPAQHEGTVPLTSAG